MWASRISRTNDETHPGLAPTRKPSAPQRMENAGGDGCRACPVSQNAYFFDKYKKSLFFWNQEWNKRILSTVLESQAQNILRSDDECPKAAGALENTSETPHFLLFFLTSMDEEKSAWAAAPARPDSELDTHRVRDLMTSKPVRNKFMALTSFLNNNNFIFMFFFMTFLIFCSASTPATPIGRYKL